MSLKKLKTEGVLQLALFDERNLFEFKSEHYPKDRLVACRNPELMKRRAKKRRSMIAATKAELEKIKNSVRAARPVQTGASCGGVEQARGSGIRSVQRGFQSRSSLDISTQPTPMREYERRHRR